MLKHAFVTVLALCLIGSSVAVAAPAPASKTTAKTIKFADGSYYVGAIKANKPDGKGKVYNRAKQLICDCEYKAGIPVRGTAYLFDPKQKKYQGEFKLIGNKRVFEGNGTLTFLDGSKYVGQFVAGKFDGEGIFYNPKGVKTKFGKWWQNELNNGTQVTETGEQITGVRINGLLQGAVDIVLPNGDKIIGDYKDGKLMVASLIYKDGTVYNGEIRNYKANGKGYVVNQSGIKSKDGIFADNQFIQGTLMDADFNEFTGQFEQGKLTGNGELKLSDGSLIKGNFTNGDIASGTIEYPDGTKYEGPIKHFKADDTGLSNNN